MYAYRASLYCVASGLWQKPGDGALPDVQVASENSDSCVLETRLGYGSFIPRITRAVRYCNSVHTRTRVLTARLFTTAYA